MKRNIINEKVGKFSKTVGLKVITALISLLLALDKISGVKGQVNRCMCSSKSLCNTSYLKLSNIEKVMINY